VSANSSNASAVASLPGNCSIAAIAACSFNRQPGDLPGGVLTEQWRLFAFGHRDILLEPIPRARRPLLAAWTRPHSQTGLDPAGHPSTLPPHLAGPWLAGGSLIAAAGIANERRHPACPATHSTSAARWR
jgi:hypothetical protein